MSLLFLVTGERGHYLLLGVAGGVGSHEESFLRDPPKAP